MVAAATAVAGAKNGCGRAAGGLPLELVLWKQLELELELESKRWVYRWDCGEKGAVG